MIGAWGKVLESVPAAAKREGISLHAGVDETSLMLFLKPDLVSQKYRLAPHRA